MLAAVWAPHLARAIRQTVNEHSKDFVGSSENVLCISRAPEDEEYILGSVDRGAIDQLLQGEIISPVDLLHAEVDVGLHACST